MKQWGLVVLIAISLFVLPTSALELEVSTTIPEYIMEDHLNLTGTTTLTLGTWKEDSTAAFNNGLRVNVTVLDDNITLKPELGFSLLNNGQAVMKGGSSSSWDYYLIAGFDVVNVSGTYYMYYTGSMSTSLANPRHIGLATSTDGISWTKYSGNPVVRSGVNSYELVNIMSPAVLYDNGTWHMWYAGNHGHTGSHPAQDVDICYANSSDGYNWTKYSNNPVLKHGATNWDSMDVRPTSVMKDNQGFTLYYKAVPLNPGNNIPYLAKATSSDGISWTTSVDNPLRTGDPNGWETGKSHGTTLEGANSTYRMWTFAGGNSWKVGWLSSIDGVDWEDSGSQVLSPVLGTIYSKHLMYPRVSDTTEGYMMFVECMDINDLRTIGAFKVERKKMDGRFTSQEFDAGGIVTFNSLNWTADVPSGGSLSIQARWGDQTSNLTNWTSINRTEDISNVTARYFQYRADFKAYEDWFRVTLGSFNIDYTVPMNQVEVSVEGGQWQPADLIETQWYLNTSLHDGDYIIDVKVTDSLGDSITKSIPVKVDLYDPVLSLVLEEGRYATSSPTISYSLAGEDTHGISEQMISFRPDFLGAVWEPYNPVGALESPISNGYVSVYAKLKDGAGRISINVTDSIIVDTTPPVGRLLIEGGAAATNDPYVMLNITWTDLSGVVDMMVSNDADFTGAAWQTSNNNVQWSLEDVDGERTVYVRLRDAMGWTADLSSEIILDRTQPSATLTINNDDLYTSSRNVDLSITFHDDNPVLVKFSNAADTWPDIWRDLVSPIELPWELTGGEDGIREVRLLVRDAAGNEIVVIDDILLDTTPPEVELTVADGNQFISELLVGVQLVATDATSGVAKMRMSNTGYFTDVAWKEYNEESTWLFPEGEGMKTLFVQVMDGADLITTLDTTVIMDTTAPTGTFTINDGDAFVQSSRVSLRLNYEDDFGLDFLRVSNSASFEDAQWVAFMATMSWDLMEEGERTVYLEVLDRAGNVATSEATIIYDETPPVIEYLSPTKKVTTEEKVTVEVSVVDNVDQMPVVEWRMDAGAWETLVGTSFQIKLADGDHTIEVCATDGAGNEALETIAMEKEPEPSIASSLFLWIIIVVVVVVIAVGYWQWKGKDIS